MGVIMLSNVHRLLTLCATDRLPALMQLHYYLWHAFALIWVGSLVTVWLCRRDPKRHMETISCHVRMSFSPQHGSWNIEESLYTCSAPVHRMWICKQVTQRLYLCLGQFLPRRVCMHPFASRPQRS